MTVSVFKPLHIKSGTTPTLFRKSLFTVCSCINKSLSHASSLICGLLYLTSALLFSFFRDKIFSGVCMICCCFYERKYLAAGPRL